MLLLVVVRWWCPAAGCLLATYIKYRRLVAFHSHPNFLVFTFFPTAWSFCSSLCVTLSTDCFPWRAICALVDLSLLLATPAHLGQHIHCWAGLSLALWGSSRLNTSLYVLCALCLVVAAAVDAPDHCRSGADLLFRYPLSSWPSSTNWVVHAALVEPSYCWTSHLTWHQHGLHGASRVVVNGRMSGSISECLTWAKCSVFQPWPNNNSCLPYFFPDHPGCCWSSPHLSWNLTPEVFA